MKKNYIQVAVVGLIFVVFFSCKKTVDKILPTSSLTVYNCLTDGSTLFTKLNGSETVRFTQETDGIPAPFLALNNFKNLGLPPGGLALKLYAFPDSVQAISSASLNLKAGSIYSFFISGDKTNIDTLFTKDDIPAVPVADSITFIRVVNLVKTGGPITVSIAGKPPLAAAQNLNYKGISKFIALGVKQAQYSANSFVFEVRRSTDNQLLSTFIYSWNLPNAQGGGTNYLSKATTVLIIDTGTEIKCEVVTPILVF